MSPRLRGLAWLLFLVLLGGGLWFGYQHWVLEAPPESFRFTHDGEKFELTNPKTLAVVLLAPLLLFVLGRSLADLPRVQQALSFLFRLAFLTLLALALGELTQESTSESVCTVVLIDISESITDESLKDAQKALDQIIAAKAPDDVVKLVTFAERPRLVELREEDGKVSPPAELRPKLDAKKDDATTAGSNLQAALQLGYALFPHDMLKRAVLISDGLETRGDLLAEVNRARRFKVRLSTIPFRRPPPAEVALKKLSTPDKVDVGQPFELVADIYSSRKATVRARLYQGEALNGLDGVRELELEPGNNEVKFQSVVRIGGPVTYALQLDRIARDRFKQNNAFSVTLDVPGRPQVLYVEGQPGRAGYLTSALSAQQFDVDMRAPTAFPASIKELERFNFLIVSDVPKEKLGLSSQQLIEQYLRDLGGGFLFAGGESGYGLGGWAHTTMERILPVRMDAERRREIPSVAMVLVIDRSTSMSGLPIEMAKEACRATVSTLQGDDLIEVIAFDSEPTRYVKMQPASYRGRIQNQIASIQPGGGTQIFPSLDMAYQDISVTQARRKHVILLTDGNASTQGIRDLAQAMLAESITVTTVGLGGQVNEELLRMIADTGGGRYHHAPDPQSLPRIFTRETEMISRQAAVEEWFPVQQTGNADFLRGIAISAAPLLHGYVATAMKPPPAQQLLASDRAEPILARWRVGLGWSLAWTSDVKNLWAVDWLRWPAFSKFWGQLVREHMRQKHQRELPMRLDNEAGLVRATVDAFTIDERFDNDMESTLTVKGPAPEGERREVALKQTAPGRYQAEVDLQGYGSFLVQAEHKRRLPNGETRSVGVSYGHVSNPYPREYESFEPDIDRLKRAALAGGGQLDPEPKAIFDPQGESILFQDKRYSHFLLAALAVFLLDLLVRRVRLFDRKVVPKKLSQRRRPAGARG